MASPTAPLIRGLVYGLAGCAVEAAFTTTVASLGSRRLALHGPSTPWMILLYGLAVALFEPLHDRLRTRPIIVRGMVYAAGVFGVEAAAGLVFRGAGRRIPWDYSGRSRWALGGLVRLDYAPLWAILGLAAERLHDRMSRPR